MPGVGQRSAMTPESGLAIEVPAGSLLDRLPARRERCGYDRGNRGWSVLGVIAAVVAAIGGLGAFGVGRHVGTRL
jgi:hypothetical protein